MFESLSEKQILKKEYYRFRVGIQIFYYYISFK